MALTKAKAKQLRQGKEELEQFRAETRERIAAKRRAWLRELLEANEEATQEEIAEVLSIDQSRVSQLLSEARAEAG